MKILLILILVSAAICQVTFPDQKVSTTTSTTTTTTPRRTESTRVSSSVASRPTLALSTSTSSTNPTTSRGSSGSTTVRTTPSTTPTTTTSAPTTSQDEPDPDANNCMCLPIDSCQSLGGNATEPETDGSGILDPRIVNSASLTYDSYGTNESITSPIATGTTLKTTSPQFCVKQDILELCCPQTGYQCGLSFPTIPVSKIPPGSAKYGQFPWQAIIFTFKQFYVGSGVLIDQYHVMSAAHKFDRFNSNMTYKVRLGDWDTSSLSEPLPYLEFNVSKIIKHPNYNSSNLRFDLIILRLVSPVPLGRYPTIGTACLPATPIPPPTRCWVSGFGQNDFVIGTNQAVMKAVDVPLVEFVACQKKLQQTKLKRTFALHSSFLCAGGEVGKDACTGDGGAPLVCNVANRSYVQGLVSWGVSCGKDIPSVYVNVSSFIPWIRSVTSF